MKKIVRARIGQCLNMKTNEVGYQLQFKAEGEHRYDGFSVDDFKTEHEASQALEKHNSGDIVYKPFASLGGMSRYFLCKIQTK